MRRLLIIAPLMAVMLMFTSCNTEKKIIYFQDRDQEAIPVQPIKTIRVRPADKIAIIVKCEDMETTTLFNLVNVNQVLGSNSRFTMSGSNGVCGYTVDPEGYIDFPVLGKIGVAGMTRSEVAETVRQKLEESGQAKGASVTVEFMDLGVTVLGEVKNPGRKAITRDTYTILEALGDAGDLTIDAKRANLMLSRDEGDSVRRYFVDMRDQQSLLASPAYYLQQNDIIYAEPTTKKARTSTVNGNTILSASFWVSIASLVATLVSLVIRYN